MTKLDATYRAEDATRETGHPHTVVIDNKGGFHPVLSCDVQLYVGMGWSVAG